MIILMNSERIMELNEQRRDLWEVIRKYENQPFVQIAAHKEIHALTKSIMQLYQTLPLILKNNNNNTNALSGLIYEDTTSLYPEVSVYCNRMRWSVRSFRLP